MRSHEFITEKWTAKYKRSINCSNPKGFSQRAHCQGRKKKANEEYKKDGTYLIRAMTYEDQQDDLSQYITKALRQAGYEFIGSGYDAQVWMKDEGTVVKILMPKQDNKSHESFRTFYNFSKSNSDLPNVPKFKEADGQEVFNFTIKGKPFVQYGMEQLYPLDKNSLDEWVVWMMADLSAKQMSVKDAFQNMRDEKDKFGKKFAKLDKTKLKEYAILYNTLKALHKIGSRKGYGWDPHTENVMKRDNGTIVITDPWA